MADFIAQGMKSAGWVFGFPAFLGRVEGTYAPVISRERLEPWSPVRMSLTIQALLAHSLAVYLGMLGATVLLLRVYLRSPREALCLFLLFGLLTSYPGAQFSVRHVFQFEAIWVVSFALARGLGSRVVAQPACSSPICCPLRGGCGHDRPLLPRRRRMAGARFDRRTRPTAGTSEGNRRRVPIGPAEWGSSYLVPVPEAHRSLVEGPPDSMTPAIALKGAEWDVRAAADRMLVHVSGTACPFDSLKLDARYTRGNDTWQSFDTELGLIQMPEGNSVTFLVPAFYRASQHSRDSWSLGDWRPVA